MFEWVSNARVAVQINDVVFVHGGISGHYCRDALQSMTEHAHAALKESDPDNLGILTDENGPLWYRGLAGVAPEAPSETVEAILDRHDARHIVIGHTPTGGIIWPRYSGRVIQIDTGISAAYGGHVAYLEITPQGLSAGYLAEKIELPGDAPGGRNRKKTRLPRLPTLRRPIPDTPKAGTKCLFAARACNQPVEHLRVLQHIEKPVDVLDRT